MSRTRTITLTVGSLAVGALLATGATGLAMADDTGASTTSSAASAALGATSDGPGAHAGMRGGPDGSMRGPGAGHKGMRGGPIGQPLHGEAVVKAEDGTILTVRQVHGTVTAVSADSITVEAEDGYSRDLRRVRGHRGPDRHPPAGRQRAGHQHRLRRRRVGR